MYNGSRYPLEFCPTMGISQGSALSAFVFTCYVNDVFANNVQSTILAYADDFKIMHTSEDIDF